MAEQWYYRMFGEQFGPMPLEGLKELAENGTIQALDQVRSSSSGTWVDAASVEELGLSTSERGNVAVATSISDFEISTPQSSNNDEWFCLLGDHELGPLSFDELLKFAEQEQLSADDQVKLGANGKWRRAGSIGRLMAALPYTAHEKKIVPAAQKPAPAERHKKSDPIQSVIAAPVTAPLPTPNPVVVPDPELTYRLAYEQAKAKVMESMLAQADATFKAAEEQAQAQIAWASAPNVDRFWWGWSGGVEFGPVEFSQVFGLAKIGQLKPSDFVRNGQFAQYVPSSSVPGLYQAVDMIARATAAREMARAQAQAAASLAAPPAPIDTAKLVKPVEPPAPAPAPTPVTAKPKSDPAIPLMRTSDPQISTRAAAPTPVELAPIPEPEPEPPQRSYSGSTSGGYSSMGGGGYSSMGGGSSTSTMSTYGMNRPAPTPVKSYPKKSSSSSSSGSSWFSDMLESMKEPKALGSIALVAFIGLILGWGYLPKSRGADIKKYQALKQVLEEIQQKRSNPSEIAALQQKITKMGKEMAAELKDKASPHEPAKQCLLWATRDEIPRMLNAGFATESVHEKNFAAKLKEAAVELGLEKRPPVDLAALARANQD